ncbi:hypothetical protein [Botrimarina sp.]|uniref:hypothetical protein n=1 Tax=Botrimarina sp. TaxID=2795802 RepID=UPI0032EC02AE
MARKAHPESALAPDPPSRKGGAPADLYRLEGTYERLRRALVQGPADGRLERPLSFWVLPDDRRLPIAFLDRPIRVLLERPLVELMQTPGVGRKKILGFFELLRRAVKDRSAHEPFGLVGANNGGAGPAARRGVGVGRDTGAVSESVWADYCETVRRAGFEPLPLGCVAPSLKPLPTVLWRKPLADYAGQSLAEIRALKTHGEKRVSAIIEVFATVHEAASTAALDEHLQLDLRPHFVRPMTDWLLRRSEDPSRLTLPEARQRLAQPLIHQTEIDLGADVARLASERLGLAGDAPSVKEQAERLRVTRARVYQMFDDCSRVLAVRWPEGRWLMAALDGTDATPDAAALVRGVRAIFFPV